MKKTLGNLPNNLAWIDIPNYQEEESTIQNKQSSSKNGLPYGWTRATFIVKEEYSKKLKALAYWDRVTVKELMDNLLADYFKGKKIRSIPKK